MNTMPRMYRNQHGTFYFRLTRHGKKHRFSLHTKDFATAKIEALKINLYVEMNNDPFDLDKLRKLDIEISPQGVNLRNVEAKDLGVVEEILQKLGMTNHQFLSLPLDKMANALATGNPEIPGKPVKIPVKQKSEKISEVARLYLLEAKIDNVPKTVYDKNRIYEEFILFFEDKDINQYTPNEAVAYKNRLLAKGTGASVINTKMSYMRMLFLYGINNNLYFEQNPFDKVKISTKSKLKRTTRSYKEFTDDDLKKIFEEIAYRDYLDKPDYFWLPLIAMYTGARVEELASLKLEQVIQEDGIWLFDITKAKNSNSIRKIPIHKKILESNFLGYLKDLQDKNEPMLFPNRKRTKNGYSKSMSRRFGEYLDIQKITDDRKVFNSFRTTFINRMTNIGVHPAILMAIVGHYEQSRVDFSSPHFANYQNKNKPMEVLKEVIDRLEFPINIFH